MPDPGSFCNITVPCTRPAVATAGTFLKGRGIWHDNYLTSYLDPVLGWQFSAYDGVTVNRGDVDLTVYSPCMVV